MPRLLSVALGLTTAACLLASPALADEIMMTGPDGTMKTVPMPDKQKMEMILKEAQEAKDMAIIVWGHKVYIVKNKKMDNGQMMFDYWGFHYEK